MLVYLARQGLKNKGVAYCPHYDGPLFAGKHVAVIGGVGEIVVDKHGATNIPGVFAAGDCTDSPYKQIIISMGSGAKASSLRCIRLFNPKLTIKGT